MLRLPFGKTNVSLLSGAPVRQIIVLQYSISATIAYLAGMITATAVASMDTNVANSGLIYDVILVVVLGGLLFAFGLMGDQKILIGIGLLLLALCAIFGVQPDWPVKRRVE